MKAAANCHKSGLQLVSLDTKDEETRFLDIVTKANPSLLTEFLHIGGITLSNGTANDWFWIESGEKVGYALSWALGDPNMIGIEHCLALSKKQGKWEMYDISCGSVNSKFICSKKCG